MAQVWIRRELLFSLDFVMFFSFSMRLLLCFSALVAPVFAQVTTGSISGYVFDPANKPLFRAKVTATDSSRSLVRDAITDESGFYRFVELPPADYNLTSAADRFEPVTVDQVRVAVNSRARVDFQLPVAGMKQAITVSARVHAIQSESSDLGTVVDESRIQKLPLNRRDFLQLALLAPGVLPPVEDSELSTRGSFAMHANGGREEFNNFLLDGVDNNDQNVNRYVLQPSVDAIQEFKISTNNYTAEYGRSGGAQVNVITRSGSNQLHGFVYEYLRNRVLDARNFFDSDENSKYIRNQFGAGVGGPAVKDRTFFFANFDGLRERRGLTRLGTVPLPAARQGDFSGLNTVIVDPFTRAPFPGNRIPAARISPVALKVLDLFPLPNQPGASGNHLAQPVLHDTQSQFNGRLDHRLTSLDHVTLRYSYGKKDLLEPFAEESTDVPGFGDVLRDRGHNAMVHHLHTFGPRAFNSVILGFNRATRQVLPENYQVDVNKLWGVTYLPTRERDFGYPGITVAGYSRIGDVTQLPIDRAANTYQITDAFALLHRNHGLKFGGEMRRLQFNGILDLLARGSLTFAGALSGSGISDLLLGFPTLAIQSQADNTQTQRTTAINFYAHDDWKVRPNLTLNLGIRYEYNTPVTDPSNRMTVFDLGRRTLVQVGSNGVSRSGYEPDRNNLAPRVGLAWTPGPNFVVRAGYGLFYDSGMTVVNSALYFNPPYFNIRVFFPTATSLLTLNDPFPARGGITPPPSLSTLSPDLTTAVLQHWNLNLQRDIGPVGTFSIAYAGSKGTHLIRSRDLNQPRPGPGDIAGRVPYPGFSNIFFTESGSNSIYHSLQASFNRPLARGLSMLAVYTFSKSIDDTSAFLGNKADKNFPQDSLNYRAERAVSSFDIPHRATVASVYRLPVRSWWMRNTEARAILSARTGQPFTPILRFDNSNTGNTGGTFGSDRPNLLRDPKLENPTPERWFDTSALPVPPRYTFGSAGRNILRGPALFTLDVSLARQFWVRERTSFSVEAGVFNLLNRTNFDLPERFADEPGSFGRIFSAKPPRQVQVALRFHF
jgi:hypothetical protein